jgi:hypothetical protein
LPCEVALQELSALAVLTCAGYFGHPFTKSEVCLSMVFLCAGYVVHPFTRQALFALARSPCVLDASTFMKKSSLFSTWLMW